MQFLYGHGKSPLFGTSPVARVTTIEERAIGGHVTASPVDSERVRDLVVAPAKAGVLSLSMGFRANEGGETWRRAGKLPVRKLVAVDLFEVSATPFAAYANTELSFRDARRHVNRIERWDPVRTLSERMRDQELEDRRPRRRRNPGLPAEAHHGQTPREEPMTPDVTVEEAERQLEAARKAKRESEKAAREAAAEERRRIETSRKAALDQAAAFKTQLSAEVAWCSQNAIGKALPSQRGAARDWLHAPAGPVMVEALPPIALLVSGEEGCGRLWRSSRRCAAAWPIGSTA